MLELNSLHLQDGRALLHYKVVHNVGILPTVLSQDLRLEVDQKTGQCTACLTLADLEADRLENAREHLATWCDRMSAALRSVERSPSDFPVYRRALFKLEDLQPWQLAAYERLRAELKALALSDVVEFLKDEANQQNPLALIPGCFDQLRAEAERQKDPEA